MSGKYSDDKVTCTVIFSIFQIAKTLIIIINVLPSILRYCVPLECQQLQDHQTRHRNKVSTLKLMYKLDCTYCFSIFCMWYIITLGAYCVGAGGLSVWLRLYNVCMYNVCVQKTRLFTALLLKDCHEIALNSEYLLMPGCEVEKVSCRVLWPCIPISNIAD